MAELLWHLVVGRLCVLALDSCFGQASGLGSVCGKRVRDVLAGTPSAEGLVNELWATTFFVLDIATGVVLPYRDASLAWSGYYTGYEMETNRFLAHERCHRPLCLHRDVDNRSDAEMWEGGGCVCGVCSTSTAKKRSATDTKERCPIGSAPLIDEGGDLSPLFILHICCCMCVEYEDVCVACISHTLLFSLSLSLTFSLSFARVTETGSHRIWFICECVCPTEHFFFFLGVEGANWEAKIQGAHAPGSWPVFLSMERILLRRVC